MQKSARIQSILRKLRLATVVMIGLMLGLVINDLMENSMPPTVVKPAEQARVMNLIVHTNAKLLENVRTIRYGRTLIGSMKDKDYTGTYIEQNRKITITPGPYEIETYYHELGHAVFFEELTDDERTEFTHIHDVMTRDCDFDKLSNVQWQMDAFDCKKNNPSQYALKNVKEDYAELFSRYVVGHDIDPIRLEFLNRTVRRITNCTDEKELYDCVVI